MFYSFDRPDPALTPNPFKACVIPRPIGWISSLDAAGNRNLAPFSFFNAINEEPPMVMYCPSGSHIEGGPKDSAKNARETGEFVVNLATWDLREAMNRSSARVHRMIDEFELAGLTPARCERVRAPRVLETPVSLECVVTDIYELPSDDPAEHGSMIIGRVLGMHVDERVIDDGRVSAVKLRPIARLGYREYAVLDQVFKMSRPNDEP